VKDGAAEETDGGGAQKDKEGPSGDLVGVGGVMWEEFDVVVVGGVEGGFDFVEVLGEGLEVVGVNLLFEFVDDVGDKYELEILFEGFELG
jgi:hypothetical protein